jgi:hypothetical protein
MQLFDPGPAKVVHRARLISPSGAVSALCSPRPKAINLKLETWTNRDVAVTCPGCRALLSRDPDDAALGDA